MGTLAATVAGMMTFLGALPIILVKEVSDKMMDSLLGFLGIIASSPSPAPWGLAFAAGAMLWVSSHEIIPETHRKGFEKYATSGVMIGFALMTLLDNSF